MSAVLLAILAAAVAAAAAAWSYGWREEPVPGRAGPATLRALAVFFLLGGFFLPPLAGDPARPRGAVWLLDVSRSMALPAAPGAGARIDSARALLRRFRPERVVLFGSAPIPVGLDSALARPPAAARSRLGPALEAAAAAGADSVVVVGDGEWDDGSEAARAAARLDLGVRELRVTRPVARLALASARAPGRAAAGDTVRVEVELVAGGTLDGGAVGDAVGDEPGAAGAGGVPPDSVRLEVRRLPPTVPSPGAAPGPASDATEAVASLAVAVPTAGRRARGVLSFVPRPLPAAAEGTATGGRSEWRRYEVSLPAGADPYAAADRRTFWLEVSEEPGGPVLVSTRADWEPRFLLPVLGRSVLGGARGFLRVAPGRWVEMGPRPRPATGDEVERAVGAARLLALQVDPADAPPWLARAAERHPRRLLLAAGSGPVPGTPAALSGPLTGDWYPAEAAGPAPVARLLSGLPLEALPPLEAPWSVDGLASGAGDVWTALAGRRNRRGEARPLAVAGDGAAGRWALVTGRGYWGWALRDGTPRRAYEGLFAGLAGWLVEDFLVRPVELVSPVEAGGPVRWRVSPGVSGLEIVLRDSTGREAWSGRWARPPAEVEGPRARPGEASYRAAGSGPEGAFERVRPFTVPDDPREALPRTAAVTLERPGGARGGGRSPGRGGTPVWPVAVAALLFCAEWVWRRRIGLR